MVRRAEGAERGTSMAAANDLDVRRILEAAGVEFIDESPRGPFAKVEVGDACSLTSPMRVFSKPVSWQNDVLRY
jgi:hypothetical protein